MLKIQAQNLMLNVEGIKEVQIRTYNYQSNQHNVIFRFFRTLLKLFELDFPSSSISLKAKTTEGIKFTLIYQSDDSGALDEVKLKEAHDDYHKLSRNFTTPNTQIECHGILTDIYNTNPNRIK